MKAQSGEYLQVTVYIPSEHRVKALVQKECTGTFLWSTELREFGVLCSLPVVTEQDAEERFRSLERCVGAAYIRKGDVPLAEPVIDLLKSYGLTLACAESCTGGYLGKAVTDISGSSDVFWGGCIVYSNEAKISLLGVPADCIAAYGAVSRQTVEAMACGVVERVRVDIGVAVSGIAGPSGGTAEKPVGTVWICVAHKGKEPFSKRFQFSGARMEIRKKAVIAALKAVEYYVCEKLDMLEENEYS